MQGLRDSRYCPIPPHFDSFVCRQPAILLLLLGTAIILVNYNIYSRAVEYSRDLYINTEIKSSKLIPHGMYSEIVRDAIVLKS